MNQNKKFIVKTNTSKTIQIALQGEILLIIILNLNQKITFLALFYIRLLYNPWNIKKLPFLSRLNLQNY